MPRPAVCGPAWPTPFPTAAANRAYLFVVDGPDGRFAWFFQNSVSQSDISAPIVVGGVNDGAPIDNLKAALAAEGLSSVDSWIGTADSAVARLLLPILAPKAYLPGAGVLVKRGDQAGVGDGLAEFVQRGDDVLFVIVVGVARAADAAARPDLVWPMTMFRFFACAHAGSAGAAPAARDTASSWLKLLRSIMGLPRRRSLARKPGPR